MAYKATRTVRKLKHVNVWGIVAGFVFGFLLLILGYYGYMKLEYSRLQKVIAEREKVLEEKKQVYEKSIDDVWFKKYQASQLLYNDDKFIERKKTISYLIAMFNKIRSVDKNISGVTLSDFQVNIDGNVRMTGVIKDIHSMYIPGGVLDQFLGFDFIESLEIPSYHEEGDVFNFVLNAIIKSHDGNG